MSFRKIGWPRALPEFFRKASLSFLMRFGGLFIQFLGSILVARLLGAQQYGAFTYAATWAVFLGLLLPFGLGELSIRELPTYLTKKKMGLLTGYLINVLVTILVTGSIAAVVLSQLEQREILVLAPGWKLVAVFAVIHGIVLSVSSALNGFQRILTSQFLETIVRQVLYLSLLGLVLLLGYNLTPERVFQLSLFAALPTLLIMFVVLIRMRRREGGAGTRPEFQLGIWFAGSLPLLMTELANRLQLDLDVLMIGGLLGDFEVGIYRAAARGAILVTIANMIAIQLVGPMLSRALANNNKQEAQRLLSQAAMVSFITGSTIILAFGIGAPVYLSLFGPEFIQASTSLRLLLIGQATIVLAGADAILLIMLHKEKFVLVVTAIGVALNFGLNITLIKSLGIEGAAIASLVSMALIRLTLVTYIVRRTGFDPTIFTPLRQYFRRFRG